MSTNTISTHLNSHDDVRQKQCFGENFQSVTHTKDKITHERSVLGSISQNTGRVQPFRAAKQNATTEGFFNSQTSALPSKPGAGPNFKIYNDCSQKSTKNDRRESPVVPSIATASKLHPALTALPTIRVPLNNGASQAIPRAHESPMLLDTVDEERSNVFDIDADAGIFGLSEYAAEIFQHLRESELLHRPKPNYMRKQQDITAGMRSILVDWLVEVADEYKLHAETIHLAVNYIDRFLSHMAVLRGKLQLVGAAAMFLAAKFEEIYPPDVGEFVYITDDTYTKKQVLRMEHLILKVLNFDVAVPTSNQYLKRFLKAANAGRKVDFLSQYLCELALIEFDCVQYLPSTIAASAVCLANFTVAGKLWDETMEFYMKYELTDLVPCIKRLRDIFEAASTHVQQALHEKYKDAKYDCVSTIAPPSHLPFDEMETEEGASTLA